MNKTWMLVVLAVVGAGAVTCAAWGAPQEETAGNVPTPALRPDEIVQRCAALNSPGPESTAAKRTLIRTLTADYLSIPAATRSLSTLDWHRLAETCARDIPADARALWIKGLHTAFVDDAATWSATPPGNVVALALTLRTLGDKEWFLIGVKAVETGGWRSLTDLADIAALLEILPHQPDGQSKQARMALAEGIEQVFLSRPEGVSRARPQTWQAVLSALAQDLSEDRRSAWAKALSMAVTADLDGLTPIEVREWADAVAVLDKKAGGTIALEWLMKKRTSWSSFEVNDLTQMGDSLSHAEAAGVKAVMEQLESLWLDEEAIEPLPWSECDSIARMWSRVGDETKGQDWRRRAYERRLKAVTSADDLRSLALWISESRPVDPGKGPADFAATTVELAKAGNLPNSSTDARVLAAPLGTPESREILRKAVADDQGRPRLPLAHVLAYAYRESGELGAWQTFLDARIAAQNTDPDPDTKALWLVAQSYAAGVSASLEGEYPPQRRAWLGRALTTARSETVRIGILDDLVATFRQEGKPQLAISLLESVKSQFGGEAAAWIAATQDRLRQEEAARQAAAARLQTAIEAAHDEAKLNYYRQCLAQAQAKGDDATVVRLRAAIEALERKSGAEVTGR